MAGVERDWLACALAEERLRLAYHSTFYSGTAALPVIEEALEGNPFRSPETERRRQLIRMRHGKTCSTARSRTPCSPLRRNRI